MPSHQSFRFVLRDTLCVLILSGAVASCSKADHDPSANPGSVEGSISPTTLEAPASSETQLTATTGPLELEPARTLRGTGIRMALPKGVKRTSRELTFASGKAPDALTFTLAHQVSTNPARDVLQRAVEIFGKRQEFLAPGQVYEVTGAVGRFAVTGTMARGKIGNLTNDMPGLMASYQEGSHMLFLLGSFPDAARGTMEKLVASLAVDSTSALDPVDVAGLKLDVPTGYTVKRDQLHPIVVLPEGDTFAPGQASLDIRVAGPSQTGRLLDEMVWTFGGDPEQLSCKSPATAAPSATAPSTVGTAASTPWHQTCSFKGRGAYRVRLDAMEDAYGGVVAAITTPDGSATHEAAFSTMVENIELTTPPSL